MSAEASPAGDEVWDVVVVGAGAGGMTAACVAAAEGCSVLLLEAADVVGGTTAISGGMVWLPGNHKMAAAGRPDTPEAARAFLDATVPGEDRSRLDSFLKHADAALRDLEARTSLRLQPVMTYPDYYPDLPGATAGGRVLEPVPFDARALGKAFALVRDPLPEFMLFGGMMISRADIPHLRRATKSPKSALRTARLLLSYGLQRLTERRGATLYLGNALVARLLKSALDLGVTLRTGAAVDSLARDERGRASVLETTSSSGRRRIRARRAIVLATGGLSHDRELRRLYTPTSAGDLTATVAPGAARRGARLAHELGAAVSPPTEEGAFWVPASTFTRADGSAGVYPHTVTDRAKPGLIAVDGNGRRFVNEALSYHEFVRAQLRHANSAIPAWLICDRDFFWKYGLGKIKPFTVSLDGDLASGYLKRGATLAELAAGIGVPADALAATVAEFNRHAEQGEDPAFGRGGDIYQRSLGDAECKPNPCVAPIRAAPFHAVAVRPADLGMSCGIATDDAARVLDANGAPVPGLFACGNDMASIMNGAYPGPGITLGPALVFGWLAGKRAAANEP
ncbi:MAG: FAD-dependent oxidoreductase [Beijerinckiaceae bacterium]